MPYRTVSELPANVREKLKSRKKRRQWLHVFNSTYQRMKDQGKSQEEAERRAFAAAWSAVKGGAKKLFEAIFGGEQFVLKGDDALTAEEVEEYFPDLWKGLGGQGVPETLDGDFRFNFPICKVDSAKRQIRGIATAEICDSHDEIMAYEGSKEAFAEWAGNVREMHSLKAVGRGIEVEYDDTAKEIYVTAFISKGAEDTWQKVQDGTLSHYSISGRRIQSTIKSASRVPSHVFEGRKNLPEKVRWTSKWKMYELSLVDAGALPIAKFELVKVVDGKPTPTEIISTEGPMTEEEIQRQKDAEASKQQAGPSTDEGEKKAGESTEPSPKPNEDAVPESQAEPKPELAKAPEIEPAPKPVEVVEKAEWTTAYVNDLPDSSFAYIESGGTKEDGKTKPRSLRHYPIKDKNGKCDAPHTRNAMARAQQQIKRGGKAGEIASLALPKIRACAKKLQIGAFKSDISEFLLFNDVFKLGFGYENEIELGQALSQAEIEAFFAENVGKSEETVRMSTYPVVSFSAKPVTFGEALRRYESLENQERFFDQLDILKRVLANTLLAPDLSLDERADLAERSCDEFIEAALEVVEDIEADRAKKSSEGEAPAATSGDNKPEKGEEQVDPEMVKKIYEVNAAVGGIQEQISKLPSAESLAKVIQDGIAKGIEPVTLSVDGLKKDLGDLGTRVEKLESQPDMRNTPVLKLHDRGNGQLPDGKSDLTLNDGEGNDWTLDKVEKEYAAIEAELSKLQVGDSRREALAHKGFKLDRIRKILKGEPVWTPGRS